MYTCVLGTNTSVVYMYMYVCFDSTQHTYMYTCSCIPGWTWSAQAILCAHMWTNGDGWTIPSTYKTAIPPSHACLHALCATRHTYMYASTPNKYMYMCMHIYKYVYGSMQKKGYQFFANPSRTIVKGSRTFAMGWFMQTPTSLRGSPHECREMVRVPSFEIRVALHHVDLDLRTY